MLLNLMGSLRAACPDWSLHLVTAEPGSLAERAADMGVHTCVVPFPFELARFGDSGREKLLWRGSLAAASVPGYVKRLRRAIRDATPDVIHANGFKMHILAALPGISGTPLIWTLNDYVRGRPVMTHLFRIFGKRCSAAIALSDSVAADARKVCGIRPPVYRVYNGIDTETFSPQGPLIDLDEVSGLGPAPPETIRVGLVATFAKWKGHHAFLEAIRLLPPDLPVRGYIVGGPLYQTVGSQYRLEELRAKAIELGVAGKVGFTGYIDKPASAMRSLDIVVHASTAPEPFGMAILEAMACGRAVIASNAGGAIEIFTDGKDALGHAPGDPQALAGCIALLAKDAELRSRLGRAARLTAVNGFDRALLAQSLVPIYNKLAGMPGIATQPSGTCAAV